MTAFCPRCGAGLTEPPPTTCGACAYQIFVNARPTANLVVVDGGRFLALRRARPPMAGHWELPGGFCDGWEHPADAAVREAREELGAAVTLGPFIGMYVGTYEFQDERLPVLDSFFLATLDGGPASVKPDPSEVSEIAWFTREDPPDLAFDTHRSAMAATRQLFAA